MAIEKFSVIQFFINQSYEKFKELVGLDEASQAFVGLARSVGARLGTTRRVIITDGSDAIVAEWRYGQGLVSMQDTEESYQAKLAAWATSDQGYQHVDE